MKLFYNFACRSRKEKMFAAIENIIAMAEHDNYLIQLALDIDDTVLSRPDVRDRLKKYKNVKAHWGISGSKIAAINRDVALAGEWDILINMSDDFRFDVKGFDKIIIKAFQDHFPNGDGFLHLHDGNQGRLATMSIIDRKHYDRFGYVYHPAFVSVYCDNFAQDFAIRLKRYKYMGDGVRLIKHMHPLHDKAYQMDDQYRYTESFYEQDKKTFIRLKKEYKL